MSAVAAIQRAYVRTIAALIVLTFPFGACADAPVWPTRPITLSVVGPVGSPPDVVARDLSERVGAALGQPIIVDNQGGGGGIIGMEQLKRAPPDGYRFAVSHLTAIAVNPALFDALPYDPIRDYEPVSLLVSGPMILVVTVGSGLTSVSELIRLVSAKPRSLFYGTTGVSGPSHIFFEQFKAATGILIDSVPFKGPAGMMQALQTEQVPMGMESYQVLGTLIRSGKVRAIAVTGASRLPVLPDVPTFAEIGLPDMGVSWLAVLAPKGTPTAIVLRFQQELSRALASAELRRSYVAIGRQVIGSTPAELGLHIRDEVARWGTIVKRAGITVQ